MKIACIIPARLKSTRFPRKVLSFLHNKPLLQWVWEAALATKRFDQVAFAVDASETAALVGSFGGTYFMTDERCQNGSERLVELHQKRVLDADIWVCWQADEPFITKEMIDALLHQCDPLQSDVWSLKKRLVKTDELHSPHIVKVVTRPDHFALYFSRSLIPYYRDARSDDQKTYYKHIGIYAYSRRALEKIALLKPAPLEQAEQLEQLRLLENGLRIQVRETTHETLGIDLPEHLAKAEIFLQKSLM